MGASIVGSCAALALALVVAGCGQQSPTAVDMTAAQVSDQRLADLHSAISGSNKERSAGQYLGFRALTDPIAECVHAEGLPYQGHYVDSWLGRMESVGSEERWTAPLQVRSTSGNARGSVESVDLENYYLQDLPSENSVKSTEQYSEVVSACEKDVGLRGNDVAPKGAKALESDLAVAVWGVDEQLGPSAPYDRCMADAGYDTVVDDVQGYQGLHEALAQALPKTIPAVDEPATDQWNDFLAYEGRALDADEACRGDTHVKAMALLDPVLDQFEADHATEISRIRARWQGIFDDARDLGWRPIPATAGVSR